MAVTLWGRVWVIVGGLALVAIAVIIFPSAWVNKMAVAPLTYFNLVSVLAMLVFIPALLLSRIKDFMRAPQWLLPIYRAGGLGFGLSVLYRNLLFPFEPNESMELAVAFCGLVSAVVMVATLIGAKAYARR